MLHAKLMEAHQAILAGNRSEAVELLNGPLAEIEWEKVAAIVSTADQFLAHYGAYDPKLGATISDRVRAKATALAGPAGIRPGGPEIFAINLARGLEAAAGLLALLGKADLIPRAKDSGPPAHAISMVGGELGERPAVAEAAQDAIAGEAAGD